MPSIITHILMSRACAGLIADSAVSNCVKEHGEIYNLGAQGPDILFFALGSKPLNKLGERMHNEGIGNFFAECVNRIRKAAVHEGRGELTAYIAGFICHYALDICTHPYIYYKTGFEDINGSIQGESAERHHEMETAIDCVLSEKLAGKSPYQFNIPEQISIAPKKRALIGTFLSEAVASSYGEFIYPEDFAKAMKDMAFVYKMLRDRTGRKRALAGALGKASGNIRIVASLMHPMHIKPLDYLNERREIWRYPWDDTIDLNFSFMDLFNKAIDDSRIYIGAFEKAISRRLEDKTALSILGSKNFSTGLESPVKFLYYNIEFENIKKE